MAIGDVSLTASARANLSALQNTADLLSTTQARLSTGKKVNSALDNASSYFSSQGFLNSANDLSNLKDSMSTALQTIQAASDAIDSITTIVEQLQGIVSSASQTEDADTRAGYASQYNDLLNQLDSLANDATFNGTNLVNSVVSQLKIAFNATNTSSLSVSGENLTSSGLGLGQAQNDFATGSLAKEVTATVSVTTTNATVTAAYSGTIDLTDNVSNVTAATGVGAEITSASTTYADGATVSIANADTVAASGDALAAVFSSLTNTSGTEPSGTGTAMTSISITGTFTADGSGSATYTTSTNTLSAAANGDITLTIAAGKSIQLAYNDGTNDQTAVYTNSGTTDVTITLHANATVSVGANGTANSTASYMLTTADVSTTGVKLSDSQTLGSSSLVDAGGATAGMNTTVYATSDGTGLSEGTTTATGVNLYDVSDATVTIAASAVKATVSGVSGTTYSFDAGSSLTVTGATELYGNTTTVVDSSLTVASDELTTALSTLRTASASLGNNNTLVQTRSDFTDSMISDLETASDNLILADTNEEGANMQALQAQNQLGIVSLGISGDLAQAILKLF